MRARPFLPLLLVVTIGAELRAEIKARVLVNPNGQEDIVLTMSANPPSGSLKVRAYGTDKVLQTFTKINDSLALGKHLDLLFVFTDDFDLNMQIGPEKGTPDYVFEVKTPKNGEFVVVHPEWIHARGMFNDGLDKGDRKPFDPAKPTDHYLFNLTFPPK